MKHYAIKKIGKLENGKSYIEWIQSFVQEKAILEHTGLYDIKEAIKALREDGYVVKEVNKWKITAMRKY